MGAGSGIRGWGHLPFRREFCKKSGRKIFDGFDQRPAKYTVEEDHGDPAELLAKLEQSEADTAKLRDRLKAILEETLLR